MRQWELFGITDRDPNWTPPKSDREPDSVVTVLDVGRDDEDLLPPCRLTRPARRRRAVLRLRLEIDDLELVIVHRDSFARHVRFARWRRRRPPR